MQRKESLGSAGSGHEFDLECVRRKNLNDCTKIATPQFDHRDIVGECDSVEQSVHELPRKCSYEPGKVFLGPQQPCRCEFAASAGRSNENTTDLEHLPKRTGVPWKRNSSARNHQDIIALRLPVLLRVAESGEHGGFEATDRMTWR